MICQNPPNISGLTDEELLALFANPSVSLYLTPGVTDDALAYLERALLKNNGKIQLSGLSPEKIPNDYLIMIVFQKLIPPSENSGVFNESTFSGINGMYQNVTGKSEDLQTYITLDGKMLDILKQYVKQCEKEIAERPKGQMALGQKYGAGVGMIAEGVIAGVTGATLYKGQLKTTNTDLLEKDIREGEIGQANRQGEQKAAKPTIEKASGGNSQGGFSSVEDLLSNATPGRVTKGKTTQYVKSGGFNEAVADSDSLYLTNVKKTSTSYGTGKRGVLSDGRTVVVRSGSSDGRPTLETRKPNGRGIEIRYEP